MSDIRSRARAFGGGASFVVGSSVVAGLLGFILNFIVARVIGADHVAGFTAVWSGTYFVVGALVGIQQEVSRAARPSAGGTPAPLRRLAVTAAAVTVVLAAAVACTWVFPVFGGAGGAFVLPLAIGPAGFAVVAVIVGSLYGLHSWPDIALLVATDAVLRLLAVGVVLAFTHDVLALAWAIAIPFSLPFLLFAPRLVRRLAGRVEFDVPFRRLVSNASTSIVASLFTALMVSGFSLLVVASSSQEAAAIVGAVGFAITVVRAPIMVGMMSLQTLLVVRFRDAPAATRSAAVLVVVVLAAGGLLALVAAAIGDPVLVAIVGPRYGIGGGRLAIIVASSALVGTLFVSGPLALALGHHLLYAAGWGIAAALTVAVLLLPIAFDLRIALALLIPPVVGLAVHAGGLVVTSRRARQQGPRVLAP